MNNWLNNSTFLAYAITCLVLCGNLLFLWGYSGAARGKTGTAMNEEDAIRFGASLAEIDPPKVARVLRAHSNAEASLAVDPRRVRPIHRALLRHFNTAPEKSMFKTVLIVMDKMIGKEFENGLANMKAVAER